ncbi:MAG TPA: endonuclease/exonuclease/phosphatase family protein [Lentimicrobium sp.]|nr:endonuclease/exonuclease/phosphatase family protein [Lentimicrobium sp.]
MKPSKFLIALILSCISLIVFGQDNTFRIMTWNIRFDNPDDGINRWDNRKAGLVKEILVQKIDILGTQEAMNNQIRDLNKMLKGYKSLGVGRDNGEDEGEYNSVYYKKANLKVVRWGVFWLSATPDVPGSRGWDAACNRLATWIEFKHKKSGEHFMVFNTHFDHIGDTARNESAQLINRKIHELSNRLPVILMGDFNVDAKSRPYRILTFPENEYVLVDTRSKAKEKSGPELSWVSFDPDYKETELIDFIFATHQFEVLKHTITDFRSRGKFLSDHLPVTAAVRIVNSE